MLRILDQIEFLISEAFVAMRRNFLMSFAAMSTAAVALFLLGGLAYTYYRVNQAASDVAGRFEMRVWLKDEVKKEAVPQIISRIRAVKGVKQAFWAPRDVEWEKWQKENPEQTNIGVANPLPESFKVILSDLSLAEQVEAQLKEIPEVHKDGVVYMKDEQEIADHVLAFLRWLGGGLGSVLLFTAAILIYNAIRLTILARRREIRIMQLVGASKFTVRTPFVIEGMVQGMMGGIVAAFLIKAAQGILEQQSSDFSNFIRFPAFPLGWVLLWLALIGAGFGILCSYLAIREPLRYRSGANI
jgi:cell division transport system permease protein